MSVKHVIVIMSNTHVIGLDKRPTGFFFPEVAHLFEIFDRADVAMEYVSPLGGQPSEDGFDENDPAQIAFRSSKSHRRLAHSRMLFEVDVLYDAVFVPGGPDPMVGPQAIPKSSKRSCAPGMRA